MNRTLEVLDRLIGFDTVSENSNLELIGYAQDFLERCGCRVIRIDDPDQPKAGLYAEIGPAGTGVLLSAHSDVVPVEGQTWNRDPFTLSRDGDRLYGRGTTDMKGFLAAMLTSAEAAGRADLREPLKLVISYDEEIGCVGISRMMERLIPLVGVPRLAIVGEPTEMQVAVGHKGKRAYSADIGGETGHSALAPQFVNALNVAADFVGSLKEIQSGLSDKGARDEAFEVPYSTVHVGTLSGGTALNIVPERAEMRFELRHLVGDDPDLIEQGIRAAAERVGESYGKAASIHIETLTTYPGLDTKADAEVVVEALRLSETSTTKVGFGTEAGFFDALGISTVVCGPGSMAGQGHKADEYLLVSQLNACEAMLARLLTSMSN